MVDDYDGIEVERKLVVARVSCPDSEILAELGRIPPLADEDDGCWDTTEYWMNVAHAYFALARIAESRRLRAAIPLLLERACYGDPGECMRGLRHTLEAIVNSDYGALAEMCLAAARSPRLGTRLWAIDELVVLEDVRAKPLFEEAVRNGPEAIRWRAERGLERLAKRLTTG